MSSKSKTGIGALIAGSLLWSSAAVAAPATGAPAPQVNPWAVLSAMSGGAPAAAICGAAAVAAAAQSPNAQSPNALSPNGCVLPVMDAPPPVVSAEPGPLPLAAAVPVAGAGISPLLFALLAIAGGAGLFFALRGKDNNRANSPA